MALVDLLDKIQSFDYNQVGKPQSFEANGGVVTGQQSFDRPLEEPLPISEALGFGPRSLLSNPQGVDFFEGRADGFTPNMEDTQFRGLNLDTNKSVPNPRIRVGSSIVRWPGPVNYFDKDGEHPFVNGFILNKGISGNGPGESDFKFLYDDLGTYTVKPELRDFGGNVYKWPAWNVPGGVNFFFGDDREDDVATGFTTNVQGTQFVNINDEGSVFDYKPNIPNTTYSWADKDTPYLANFFNDDKVPGFNKEVQLSQNFQPPAVSSQLIQNSIAGGVYSSNSYLWSTEYFDFINNNFDVSNVGSFVDPITFQSRLSIPDTSLYGSMEYRRQAGRIENMTINDSNFVTTNDEGDATEVNFVRDQVVNVSRDSEGTNLNIPSNTRESMQYPNSYTGKMIDQAGNFLEGGFDGVDEEVLVKPNKLKEFADDYFKDENKSMFIAVNDDGKALGANKTQFKFLSGKNQGRKGPETYTGYIQAMSPGDSQPFIVRKIDDHWGSGDGDGNFLGEFLGGFVRTTGSPSDSITGRLGREFSDVIRKGKYLLTSDGLAFGLAQLFLQVHNRTIETRIWNPLSLASNSFLNIKRHLGSAEYSEILASPGDAIKSFLPPILQAFTGTLGGEPNTLPEGRIKFQSQWRAVSKTPEANALAKKGASADEIKELAEKAKSATLSKFHINMHNPNHYFRLKFPVDPYKGPDGRSDENADALATRLSAGASGISNTTHTFSEKSLERSGLGNKEVKDYRYLTYGQIKTVANDKDQEYESLIKADAIRGNNEYQGNSPGNIDPFYRPNNISRQFISKDESEIVADTTGLYMKEVMDFADAKGVIGDDINASSYMNGDEFYDMDWVEFSFETAQTTKNKMNRRVIQFRASINSLNESITPEYSEQRYLGRPDKYYTYAGTDRDISIDFTLYPKTAQEFPFLMEKLNYLVGLCYPEYNTSGFMIAPYTKLNLGEMFQDAPGYISSLQVNVQDNTTWEVDMVKGFPKHITCALTYRYIGKYLPHKFGKHYALNWLDVNKSNPENQGSTLTLNDENRVIVNRSALLSSVGGDDLDNMQKKLGILGESQEAMPSEIPAASTDMDIRRAANEPTPPSEV